MLGLNKTPVRVNPEPGKEIMEAVYVDACTEYTEAAYIIMAAITANGVCQDAMALMKFIHCGDRTDTN